MENKMGNETGPAKKRPSYRNAISNSDSYNQSNSSEEETSKVEIISHGGPEITENLEEMSAKGGAPLLPPLQSYQSKDEPDCITLSSDDEMEEGEEYHWIENVDEPVIVKMENGGVDEDDMYNFKDIEADKAEQGKYRGTKGPKKRKYNDGPIIVREYSIQEQTEIADQQNICKYCEREFKTKKSLAQHIRMQHKKPKEPSIFKCETCGEILKSKTSLKNHQFSHANKHSFECSLCQTKCKSQLYLDKHLNSYKHKNAEFIQHIMENELSKGSSLEDDECLTPPPPLLLPEMSLEEVAAARKSMIYNSRETSTLTSPAKEMTSPSPKHVMDFSPSVTSSGVVGSTMSHNFHNIPTPVWFYGYMVQPNGTSYSSTYPPDAQLMYYPSYSGIAGPQTMQQMYGKHPYSLTDYYQQPSLPLFTCLECKARFSIEAHFHYHMQNAHSNDCWKCPKCLDVMISPEKFEQHYSQCVGEM